ARAVGADVVEDGHRLFLGQGDRLHHLADRRRDGVARLCDLLLEFLLRERAELARLMREILIDASLSERWLSTGFFANPVVTAALVETNRLFLGLPYFVEPARRPHAQLGGIGLEIAILGLARVAGHRHSLVADILDFVDRDGLGDRPTGGVVAGEFSSNGAVLRLRTHRNCAISISARNAQRGPLGLSFENDDAALVGAAFFF